MSYSFFGKGIIKMIKKIEKEIQKLEQQKTMKIEKKNQLENEITIITSNLKDLYNLKNQYEKLLQTTDQTLGKMIEHK